MHEQGLFKRVQERVDQRLRADSDVCLNGNQKTLAQALTLQKASTLNTLIAFQLYKLKAFKYCPGKCSITTSQLRVARKIKGYSVRAIRHGTKREDALNQAGFSEAAQMLRKSEFDPSFDSSKVLWKPGWWGENSKMLGEEAFEFVPPATQLVATTFVSTLADVIRSSFGRKKFRMTLHRLFSHRNNQYYQQICRYSGTEQNGRVGRVLPVSEGLVGLASRIGKPVVIQGENRTETSKAVNALGAKRIKSKPLKTMFAVPFLAERGGTKFVSLVLFLDTNKPSLFDESDDWVMETIYEACHGFIKNIELMKKKGELYFANTEYRGYKSQQTSEDAALVASHLNLQEPINNLDQFRKNLKFESVFSFNADFAR